MGIFKYDLERYFSLYPSNKIQRLFFFFKSQGLQGIMTYRFGHWLLKQKKIVRIFLKPLYLYLYHRVRVRWGIEIHPEAVIGKGFMIFHYGGIFIGGDAVIGDNFTIGHDVTIGVAGKGARYGMPIIGNNVTVAAGASLHGKIRIGNNVKIGANTVVNKDIPDYALVQLPPMQIVTFPNYYGDKTTDKSEKEE